MKRSFLLFVLALSLAAILHPAPAYAQCGGVCIYEVGTPDSGLAAAGAGARAEDASTAYWNPAGMTLLDKSQIHFGVQIGYVNQKFSEDKNGTVGTPGGTLPPPILGGATIPPGSTDGGSSNGGLFPGGGNFGVFKVNDRVRLGLAIAVPYGGGVDYDGNWVGKTFVVENFLLAGFVLPSVAVRITDWLSIGGGPNIVYTFFEQKFNPLPFNLSPELKIENADDWSLGATGSIMIKPRDGTRFGVVYRSKVDVDLEGDVKISRTIGGSITGNFEGSWTWPQGINVSVYHELTNKLAVLADAGWSDWSEFSAQTLQFGSTPVKVDRHWRDTWRIGTGLQYRPNKKWVIRTGTSYDSSPVEDEFRLPDIPAADVWRFAFGVEHFFNEDFSMGMTYTGMFTPNIDVNNVALPPANTVILDGEYNPSNIHIVGLSLSKKF